MRPCCGLSLQTGVEFIGLVDIINSILIVIAIFTCEKFQVDRLVVVIIEVGNMFMGFYLITGASKRCRFVCKSWIIYTTLHSISIVSYLIYRLIDDVFLLNNLQSQEYAPEEFIVTFSYLILYKIYAIYVTMKLIQEITKFQSLNKTLVNLMDKDVEDLIYGAFGNESHMNDTNKKSNDLCSDRSYEISYERLEIESTVILGSGKFGKIYSGNILTPTDQNQAKDDNGDSTTVTFDRKKVAIKTLLNTNVDDIYFKTLLSELKIMMYLGEHENIVRFIGVCTADIKNRNLWIVLEICELGNLLNYLHLLNGLSPPAEEERLQHKYFKMDDGYKWGMQIAQGLEYMERKGVVHGDISARNILLTRDKIAKISDFGLSRKIIQSKISKNQWENIPLPWRWMAIEALQNYEFSAKSDVWSYGVTMWEIFTLGETPFPNISWNSDFIKQLALGSRLPKPHYATNELYEIIRKCWNKDPLKRPSFTDLMVTFQKLQKI